MKVGNVLVVGNLTSHIWKCVEEQRKIEKNGEKDLDKSK